MTKNTKVILIVIGVLVVFCLITVSVPVALLFIRKEKQEKYREEAVYQAEARPERTYNAWVTDGSGAKTYVKEFETYYESRTGNMIIHLNAAQSTMTTWNKLHLLSDHYTIEIPFEIIDSIIVEPVSNDRKIRQQYISCMARVYLGDRTMIQGAPLRAFSGQSDLGEFKIEADRVRRIQFDHTAASAYTAAAFGNGTAEMFLKEGKVIRLDSASFKKQTYNVNGCYTGDDFPDQFEFFSDGGSTINMKWDKIAAIVPFYEKPARHIDYPVQKYKLSTVNGSEYTGPSVYGHYSAIHEIQGITGIGLYRLRVIIDFYGTHEKIVLKP